MSKPKKSLAIIGGRVSRTKNALFVHVSFGKIVAAFAKRYHRIYLCSPLNTNASSIEDYLLPDNVTLIPQPCWNTTVDSLKHLPGIKNSYKEAISVADHIFIRGNPVAATLALYKYCVQYDKPVCHWLVGNPMALLQSHNRNSMIKNTAGKLFIWQWEKKLLLGRYLAKGTFICNGQELADRYPTPKTFATVSTSLTKNDFFERKDTCQSEAITLLSLCFIRPEKGIEYLIKALSKIQSEKKVNLILAGSRDRYPEYQAKLNFLVKEYKLEKNIIWAGHIQHQEIPSLMRESDIFILPTLSEGTPRVLVEARANCLPLVATNVGGIPTSVKNGYDGILVHPKDPIELANAISKIIKDNGLRKQLIKNGYQTVQKMTVDCFSDQVIKCLSKENKVLANEC